MGICLGFMICLAVPLKYYRKLQGAVLGPCHWGLKMDPFSRDILLFPSPGCVCTLFAYSFAFVHVCIFVLSDVCGGQKGESVLSVCPVSSGG